MLQSFPELPSMIQLEQMVNLVIPRKSGPPNTHGPSCTARLENQHNGVEAPLMF